jgi:hypothetical protein
MTKKPEPGDKDRGLSRECPRWDDDFAHELVGGVLLVGITRLNAAGEEIEKIQFYGRVISAHETRGIALSLQGARDGQTYTLPPDTRAIRRAKPGRYTLKSTAEVVVDPDFTTTWTLQNPAN